MNLYKIFSIGILVLESFFELHILNYCYGYCINKGTKIVALKFRYDIFDYFTILWRMSNNQWPGSFEYYLNYM